MKLANTIGLKSCETKESQKWRHIGNEKTATQFLQYYNYLPELSNYNHSSHSICEKHYNQVIATNQFYQHLVDSLVSQDFNPIVLYFSTKSAKIY